MRRGSGEALTGDAVDTVVFDVIGTLVDEDSTFAAVAARLAAAVGLSAPDLLRGRWMDALDAHMRAVVDGTAAWQPHRQLAGVSATEAILSLGGVPTAASEAMASAVDRQHRAWPDVSAATSGLCRRHLVAAVSNADIDALACVAATQDIRWHAALSAGTARTFKPDPAAYQYAIDALRIDPNRTVFVAAHPWDLRAAADHGFRTCFVARPSAEPPSPEDDFDLEVQDLGELHDLLGAPG